MTRIVRWTTMALIVTGLLFGLYLVVQQAERQGADDAPQRLASQVAAQLSAGADPASGASSHDVVELSASDAVFFIIYDTADRPIAGTGRLDGALARVPAGVLDTARRSGVDHVTWQPATGRRFASVELKAGAYVVLGAQSLGPTEGRIDRLGSLILIIWAGAILVIGVGFLVERGVDLAARHRSA